MILRDVDTGVVSTMDLTSLQTLAGPRTGSGLGVRVALRDDAAFIIDAVLGVVQQIDPRTLARLGEPLRYPPGITGGVFDGDGRLWIAVPGQGTVSAIVPAPLASEGPATSGARVEQTSTVAPPSHDLALSTLENGVAVLNRTTNALTTIRDGRPASVTLPLSGPGSVAPHTDGLAVPVTVPDSRHVYVAADDKLRNEFPVPGDGPDLQAAVAWEGYFYVADDATGTVHVFDAAGREQPSIRFDRPGGTLELEVRENYLFINAPGAATARVVDNAHRVRVVDKYADDVLGGDKPPVPEVPPPPKPKKPAVSKPGPPRNVRAAAGNAEARVSWQPANPNGAEISKYVVTGAGKSMEVGARQRSVSVTGLTNGETYRFEVYAVNKKGNGPSRTSNPVRPTSEVPDAPAEVRAEARADGTVAVTWPAANGQGLDIERYAVTAVAEGGTSPVGESDGPELVIKAGELEYGKQYAFTVVSVNERGAGSEASPVSNAVVPFAKPDAPGDVNAATIGDRAGAISVRWSAPAANGRPISKYVVAAGDRSVDVTDTAATLDGFGAGENVQVQVRAVNEAGESDPGRATARTVAVPEVTVTGSSSTFNTATVNFSVDAGGGRATCKLTADNGGGSATGACSSLRLTGLRPSTDYTFTVQATNAAGSAEKERAQATEALFGTATCINGENGDTATYCNNERPNERNGNEIFSVTDQNNDRQVGWVPNGTRLEAYCKKTGDDVDSYIYNNRKRSTMWIQVNYKGKNYIPFAWLNLDGGDDYAVLPNC